MSVQKEITEHVNKQNKRINEFLIFDQQRENYIGEAIEQCKHGMDFSTDKINEVTNKINALAKQGIVPTRRIVTVEMVQKYARNLR